MTLLVAQRPVPQKSPSTPQSSQTCSCRLPLPDRSELDFLVVRSAEDQALHVDRRQMDAVGIEAPDRNDLLHLGDAHLARRRRRLVEVAGGLAEHEVAALVRLPALDDADVRADAALEDIIFAVEALHFLALGDLRSDPGLGVEAGNAGATRAHAFGQRALRAELDLELAGEELPFEFLVLADVGRDHLLHLPRAQQLAEAFIVDA